MSQPRPSSSAANRSLQGTPLPFRVVRVSSVEPGYDPQELRNPAGGNNSGLLGYDSPVPASVKGWMSMK
jgi:hypothetical protein